MRSEHHNSRRGDQGPGLMKSILILCLLVAVIIGAIAGSIWTGLGRWHDCRAASHSKLYCYARDIAGK